MTYLGPNLPYIYVQGGNQANAELGLYAGNNVTFSADTYDWNSYYSAVNLTIHAGAGGAGYSAGMSNIGNTSGTTGMASNRLVFAGGNNVTLSQSTNTNGNTLTISAGAFSGGMSNIGNTSGTSGMASNRLVFAGGNNITLSQSTATNGNTVTVSGIPAFSGGMSNIGNTSGTSGMASNRLVFAGGNNVTLSQSTDGAGNTISINGPSGGGGQRSWKELYIRPTLTNITNITALDNIAIFQPFYLEGEFAIKSLQWEMSRATTGSNNFEVYIGIYTYVNSTQISRLVYQSVNFSNTATVSISGIRRFVATGFTNTLQAGEYVLGMNFYNNGQTASMNYSLRGALTAAPQVGALLPGTNNYETATSNNMLPFWGRYSTTVPGGGDIPSSVAASEVRGQFSGASQPIGWWVGMQ